MRLLSFALGILVFGAIAAAPNKPEVVEIEIRESEMPLERLLKVYGELTGTEVSFTESDVNQQSLSLFTPRRFTRDQAIKLLESILFIEGIQIEKLDEKNVRAKRFMSVTHARELQARFAVWDTPGSTRRRVILPPPASAEKK